ncbi:MAG: UPF0489 family protein [Candidatus Omnitrophica bacterium]|nr:UPF0489 family protein [Candidatus Omnitrophota bacterium]
MMNIPITTIEDHHEAYYFWLKNNIKNKPLVHFDAHIDFNYHKVRPYAEIFAQSRNKAEIIRQTTNKVIFDRYKGSEKSLVNIGNYIYSAMRDGIVSDFYWVIPGDRDEFNSCQDLVFKVLTGLAGQSGLQKSEFIIKDGLIEKNIYGHKFIVTTLEDLPIINDALCDIDVDYLTTKSLKVARFTDEIAKRVPWIYPEEFMKKVKSKLLAPAAVTIAYSVNGGYTPLFLKIFGDQLLLHFTGMTACVSSFLLELNGNIKSFCDKKFSVVKQKTNELIKEVKCIRLKKSIKNKVLAHLNFLLGRIFYAEGDGRAYKRAYDNMITFDKTYTCTENNYASLYFSIREFKKAQKEIDAVLKANKNDIKALCLFARLSVRKKDFGAAIRAYKKVLAAEKKNYKIVTELCNIYMIDRKYKDALKLIKPLIPKAGINRQVYGLAARAYEGVGDYDKALKYYDIAHKFGIDLDLYIRHLKIIKKFSLKGNHLLWVNRAYDAFHASKNEMLQRFKKKNREYRRVVSKINELDKLFAYVK